MQVVIDTNVFISALLDKNSPGALLLDYWRKGRFSVVTTSVQIEELTRVLRYAKLRTRITPTLGNRLVTELQEQTVFVETLPVVVRSPDPADNFLLAMAEASQAHYLVSGDKRDVLELESHEGTQIISLRGFLTVLEEEAR